MTEQPALLAGLPLPDLLDLDRAAPQHRLFRERRSELALDRRAWASGGVVHGWPRLCSWARLHDPRDWW